VAKKGQIVDATIVRVPTQRNTRDENKAIKEGNPPVENWSEAKKRQKDTDARWVQKNGKNYYGYKNHVEADVKYKIIRDYKVTDASVHDSNVFEDILDGNNTSRDVYADSAYRSAESEANRKEGRFRAHLQRKGCKGHSLTSWEKQGNRTRARTRSRIEHIFWGHDTASRKSHSEVHRDKQGGSEAGITQHRIQHGEILLFDEADRIKGGFPEKKQIKCRLFQSRILEKEKSKR